MRTRRLPKPSLAFCIHRSYCPFPIGRDKRNRASLRGITQARSGTPPSRHPPMRFTQNVALLSPFRSARHARVTTGRAIKRERCCSARSFAGRKGGGEETFTPGHRGGGRADGRQRYTRVAQEKGPPASFLRVDAVCVFFFFLRRKRGLGVVPRGCVFVLCNEPASQDGTVALGRGVLDRGEGGAAVDGWSPLSWASWGCEDGIDVEIRSESSLVESINLAAFGVHNCRVVPGWWRVK